LRRSQYLTGDEFSIVDAYLFAVTRWADPLKVDLPRFSALRQFEARLAARRKVHAALKAEHLIQDAAPTVA
jgi:glutathione S-transferase